MAEGLRQTKGRVVNPNIINKKSADSTRDFIYKRGKEYISQTPSKSRNPKQRRTGKLAKRRQFTVIAELKTSDLSKR